jgi:hypothetical protein
VLGVMCMGILLGCRAFSPVNQIVRSLGRRSWVMTIRSLGWVFRRGV